MTTDNEFVQLNAGYDDVFKFGKLSVGLTCPIEAYPHSPVPTMAAHVDRVKLVESLGFKAVWLRDVPFNVPSFGDAGQCFDPFVYLGYLAANTSQIALGVASLILPLRHPAHIAKAAASVDVLSKGRLLLGVASGDRPEEYPAMNKPFDERGKNFSESFHYIRQMEHHFPTVENSFGSVNGGMDLLPKPAGGRVPLLITGGSQQSPEWVAQYGDGWMTYPRAVQAQEIVVRHWHENVVAAGRTVLPVMQPLYIDLLDDPATPLQPIHLGFRCGIRALKDYLKSLEGIGINHVALNLRFNTADVDETLKKLAQELLIDFH